MGVIVLLIVMEIITSSSCFVNSRNIDCHYTIPFREMITCFPLLGNGYDWSVLVEDDHDHLHEGHLKSGLEQTGWYVAFRVLAYK